MRTPGSGWGGGPLLYQTCPSCLKKKAYYVGDRSGMGLAPYKCTNGKCKKFRKHFYSDTLIRRTHP